MQLLDKWVLVKINRLESPAGGGLEFIQKICQIQIFVKIINNQNAR